METPSGHPSSPTQISTNSKQPKTPHSELSQAAPQTETSNIYHRNTNRPTQYPPQTPCITTRTKSSASYTSSSSNFENTSFTTNLGADTTETTVQRNIREMHHSIVENHLQSLKPNKIINQPAPPINKDEQTLLRKT